MTLVDRRTSCILGWVVEIERTESDLQQMVDDAPQAAYYFSDLFASYRNLIYSPGRYTPIPDKSETYRVEGDNAELRHYLARLARRSRCFSRCIHALRRAIKLFVFAWNSRQLHHFRYPKYQFHIRDFV
jgi:insertion element IS1 protein InsB